jgi:hypothetical protein
MCSHFAALHGFKPAIKLCTVENVFKQDDIFSNIVCGCQNLVQRYAEKKTTIYSFLNFLSNVNIMKKTQNFAKLSIFCDIK